MIVIQDDMLRDVIARTLHISEEEITEEKLLELKGIVGALCRHHLSGRLAIC